MSDNINNKQILILKKKTYSPFYDLILESIIEYGKPKKIFYVLYDSTDNILDINIKINKILNKENINIFIAMSYYFIDPQILINFKNKIWSIRIDGDDGLIFEHYSRWYAQIFDLNITSSTICKKLFNNFGYNSIAIPTLVKNHLNQKSNFNISYKYDISFIGKISKNKERYNLISKVNSLFKNFIVYGPDTANGFIDAENKFKLYNISKINLDFSGVGYNEFADQLFFEPNLKSKKIMTGRCFEILSSGGFLLCEYNSMLNDFLVIGEDCDVFYSEEDLLQKIKFYLNNDKLRKKIALSGYNKYNTKYSYTSYSPKMISEINKYYNIKVDTKKIIWPLSVRYFMTRFIKKSKLINIKYLYLIYNWSDIFYLFRKAIYRMKYFFSNKLPL